MATRATSTPRSTAAASSGSATTVRARPVGRWQPQARRSAGAAGPSACRRSTFSSGSRSGGAGAITLPLFAPTSIADRGADSTRWRVLQSHIVVVHEDDVAIIARVARPQKETVVGAEQKFQAGVSIAVRAVFPADRCLDDGRLQSEPFGAVDRDVRLEFQRRSGLGRELDPANRGVV